MFSKAPTGAWEPPIPGSAGREGGWAIIRARKELKMRSMPRMIFFIKAVIV
jgi:hypothetical protein